MLKKAAYYFLLIITLFVIFVLVVNYDIIASSFINSPENNDEMLQYDLPKIDNKDEKPDYYMLTDEKNIPVIGEKFAQIRKLDENSVIVQKKDSQNKLQSGVIDLNGKYIIPAKYQNINAFPQNTKGKYILANTPYGQILFDKNGKKLLTAKAFIHSGEYVIARNDFASCTLYTDDLKKLFSYKDEHITHFKQKYSQTYLVTYVEGETKYLNLKGQEVRLSDEK